MHTSATPRGRCSAFALLVITVLTVVLSWSPVRAEGEDLIFGGPGTGNGEFSGAVRGLDTDAAGNVYVLDGGFVDAKGAIAGGNFRVTKFNAEGEYQSHFSVYDEKLGINNTPTRIAVSDAGDVFVLITNANQVRRFVDGVLTTTYTVPTAKNPLHQNDFGNAPEASNAGGIYVRTLDGDPYLFVVLNNGTTVRKFNTTTLTSADITLSRGVSLVTDLAVQDNGNLYILGTDAVSGGGCLIMAFGPTGTWIKNYGSGIFERNASGFPLGDVARHFVEVDSQGNLYSMGANNEACLNKYAISEGKIYYRQAQFGFGDGYSVHGSDVFMTVGRDDRLFCLPTNGYVNVPGHVNSPTVARLHPAYFTGSSRRLGAIGLSVAFTGSVPNNISNDLKPISVEIVVAPATRVVHDLYVDYQVYDMYKNKVASGTITMKLTDGAEARQTVSFTPPKYNWYDVTFTLYDTKPAEETFLTRSAIYFGVTPTYTGRMSSPAAETFEAGESGGGWTDIPRHAFAGLPFMRIDSGYDVQSIQGLLAQAKQYGTQIIVQFENPEECKKEHVEALAAQLKGQGVHYEVMNEPDLTMNADIYTALLKNVSTWVRAIDPTAKIMGPGTCGINLGYIKRMYELGGKDYIDILSAHDYEGHESIDQNHWPWKYAQLRAIMTQFGDAKKPIWQTESGLSAIRGGLFLGGAQAIRATLRCDLFDSLGIPINHTFYYYMNAGGWRDTMYLWNGAGPFPAVLALRTRYAMTGGTLPTAKIDFGPTGNKLFLGLRYTVKGAGIVLLRNLGSEADLPLTLTVTGGNTLTVVDAFGNETKKAVAGGKVTLDVPMMPIYLKLAAGQNVSVPSINYGTNVAPGATFSYSAGSENPFGVLTNGIFEAHPVSYPYQTLWWGQLPDAPQTLDITFPIKRTVNKVLVFGSRADNNFCSLLDFDLQYWDRAKWVTIKQVRTTCPPSDEMDMGDHFAQEWLLDQNFHQLIFNAVTTEKLRLVVYRSSFGFDPDQVAVDATQKAWGNHNPSRLTLHEIEVYGPNAAVAGATKATIMADNSFELYVNGTLVGTGGGWAEAKTFNNLPLQAGKNVIAIKGIDAGAIAGVAADLLINGIPVMTSGKWKVSTTLQTGWNTANFDDKAWANATEYGTYGAEPWGAKAAGMPNGTGARWIWSANNDADDTAYLRLNFTL